ncbi:hypothetical protein [Streptomyces sp. bgisy027]|uniref:hypothetical protein n=1 Tax=Streptomyces sp. bgisy027 TaxID=3413770 RepID=UPI003D7555CF
MVTGQIVVVAAAALALQMVLSALWSGFQLIGTDPAPTSADGAADAALFGVILLVLTTLVNLLDNKVLSLVNRVGGTAEIIGAVLIIVLLLTHSERSPSITSHSEGAVQSSLLGALLVGSFTAAYVMISFDGAAEMSGPCCIGAGAVAGPYALLISSAAVILMMFTYLLRESRA